MAVSVRVLMTAVLMWLSLGAHNVSGHLCLISPTQRGSMQGLNSPGSSDCILLEAPCGGRSAQTPTVGFLAGKNYTVTFQKNLDHFNSAGPGYFNVAIAQNMGGKLSFKDVAKIPDTSDPSLHLYSQNITLPDTPGASYTMQVTYVTLNPQAPAVFYQCTDFALTKIYL